MTRSRPTLEAPWPRRRRPRGGPRPVRGGDGGVVGLGQAAITAGTDEVSLDAPVTWA